MLLLVAVTWTIQPNVSEKQQHKQPTRGGVADFHGVSPDLGLGLYSLFFCLKTHVIYRCILLRPHIQPLTAAYFYKEGNLPSFTKANKIILFCLLPPKKKKRRNVFPLVIQKENEE